MEPLPVKPPKKKPAAHEIDAFNEKYDLYALLYGDPVEVAFSIMARNAPESSAEDKDEEVALRAADMLMSYRYPRIKAIQGSGGSNGPQFAFHIDLSGKPAQLPPIDVTPTLPAPSVEAAVDLSGILGDE